MFIQRIKYMQLSQTQKTKYFFEFIPINLNKISKKIKRKIESNSEFKFALYLCIPLFHIEGTKIVENK